MKKSFRGFSNILKFVHEILSKYSNKKSDIQMTDVMILDLNYSLCNLVDFGKKISLVLEKNISAKYDPAQLNEAL